MWDEHVGWLHEGEDEDDWRPQAQDSPEACEIKQQAARWAEQVRAQEAAAEMSVDDLARERWAAVPGMGSDGSFQAGSFDQVKERYTH